jgi:hypothetical protein
MAKIIEVTVSPKGETSIQTKGFTGGECREASRRLETALGVRNSEQLTSEFHATDANTQSARQ